MKIKKIDDKPMVIHKKKETEIHRADKKRITLKENAGSKQERDKKINADMKIKKGTKAAKSLKQQKAVNIKQSDKSKSLGSIYKSSLSENKSANISKKQVNMMRTGTETVLNKAEKSAKNFTEKGIYQPVSYTTSEKKKTDIDNADKKQYLKNNSLISSISIAVDKDLAKSKKDTDKTGIISMTAGQPDKKMISKKVKRADMLNKRHITNNGQKNNRQNKSVMTDTEYAQRKYNKKLPV